MNDENLTQTEREKQSRQRMLLLVALVLAVIIGAIFAWPYLEFLTDRDALRELILGAGPWAPAVYMLLQLTQVVIAPIPASVIGLAGGYIFETFWSTVYAMIGTTLGFWVVFVISKKYGRRVMKYFVPPRSVEKYDNLATSKGGFVFVALGFLFPFIPDPVLGYIAGTTPISTRVLMIIAIVMRTPGVLMTSLVGSQFGQGNYKTVGALVIGLVIVLILSAIFYKQISAWADKLYAMAIRDNQRAHRERRKHRIASTRRRIKRRRRRKSLTKKVSKAIRRPVRSRKRKTKRRR